jgi:hypothetical protein
MRPDSRYHVRSAAGCTGPSSVPVRAFHPGGLEAEARERLSWLRMSRR